VAVRALWRGVEPRVHPAHRRGEIAECRTRCRVRVDQPLHACEETVGEHGSLDRLLQPFNSRKDGTRDGRSMVLEDGESQMRPVADAPERNLRHAQGAAKVLDIRRALARRVAVHIDAGRRPLLDAVRKCLASESDQHRACEWLRQIGLRASRARLHGRALPYAALVQRDHITQLAQSHEQRKARTGRRANTRRTRPTREIDDRRSRRRGRRAKAHEAQHDTPRRRIGATLGNGQRTELGIHGRAVWRFELVRAESQGRTRIGLCADIDSSKSERRERPK
jgi:hypothetical protein